MISANGPNREPVNAGLDLRPLEALATTAAEERPWLDSLLVIRNGTIVFERYFGEVRSEDMINIYSITKCWLSCLVGIALEKKVLPSIDMPLVEIFKDRVPAGFDPRKRSITIRHCLAMQSGLGYENTFEFATELGAAADPVAFFFSERLPFRHAPGTVWTYSGADSQMVAEALRVCADRPLTEIANEWLAKPLGIANFVWPCSFPTPDAATWPAEIGASELRLTPRDMAALGECVRKNGRVDARQVVPASWLNLATTPSENVDMAYLNRFYASLGIPPLRGDAASYGLHFPLKWLDGHRVISLAGSGGQYAFAVPDLALTVVQTAHMLSGSMIGDGTKGGVDIMLDVILPAVHLKRWRK